MMEHHYYRSFSTEQFLEDPFFIQWVRDRTPEAEQFWNAWIDSKPANLRAMREAEWRLSAMFSVKRIHSESGEKEEVWQKIEHSVAFKKIRIKRVARWAVAASIVLCLGLWLLERSKPVITGDMAHSKEALYAPGNNKAILTLADGSSITLDAAHKGTISKQGNAIAIKLNNGELAYRKSTDGNHDIVYNTITVPRGGQYQLTLSDGTKVWLNAESALRFPTSFSKKDRTVTLSGEGYFEIARDEKRPFYVHVDSMQVQVLGTHFNINAYKDEGTVRTTLIEGAVKISGAGQNLILGPGEQAAFNLNRGKLQKVADADMDRAIAWKEGYFSFKDDDVQTIMRQFARWYDIEVIYRGPKPRETFSGKVYRNMNLKQVLEILKFSNLKIQLAGRKLIISAR